MNKQKQQIQNNDDLSLNQKKRQITELIQKTINTNDATTTQQTNQKAADFNKRCDACVNSRLASRFGSCANTRSQFYSFVRLLTTNIFFTIFRCNQKFARDGGSNLVILKKKKELWRKKQCSKCKRTWHRVSFFIFIFYF